MEDAERIILDTAARHFAEKGLAGARVDEIARDAGVNKAMLYYRIGDKEALYQRVLETALSLVYTKVSEAIEAHTDVEERLRRHIFTLVACIDENPNLPALIMRELANGAQHMPEAALADMKNIRLQVGKILEDGERQGLFRAVNPFLIHMQIIGTLMFFAAGAPVRNRLAHLGDDTGTLTQPLAQAAETLLETLLHALRVKPAQSPQ